MCYDTTGICGSDQFLVERCQPAIHAYGQLKVSCVTRRKPVCTGNFVKPPAHKVGADYLVTGDEDLLVLGQYGTTNIITPRDFESFFPD